MARTLYGVFAGSKFGMTWNKRVAIREAKRLGGTVRYMADPESSYWDGPTFRVSSRPLDVETAKPKKRKANPRRRK